MLLTSRSDGTIISDWLLWKQIILSGTITEIPIMGFAWTIGNSIRKGASAHEDSPNSLHRSPPLGHHFAKRSGRASQFTRLGICMTITWAIFASAGCHKQVAPPSPYLAFVVNKQSQSVAVVNMASTQIVARIPVAPMPFQAVRRPKSNEVYVVSQSGKISVIDFPALAVSATIDIGQSAGDTVFSPDVAMPTHSIRNPDRLYSWIATPKRSSVA